MVMETRPGNMPRPCSDCFHIESRDPDVDLLKARLQPFLQLHDDLPIALCRSNVHEDLHQLVTIDHSSVFPLAFDNLQLMRHRAELLTQPVHEFSVELLGDGRSVVKPPREINLVAA